MTTGVDTFGNSGACARYANGAEGPMPLQGDRNPAEPTGTFEKPSRGGYSERVGSPDRGDHRAQSRNASERTAIPNDTGNSCECMPQPLADPHIQHK